MNRIALTCSILVLFTPPALAEGDEEILERVRVLVTATFQEEIAGKLPESFTESGLAPSDRKRLIDQLADDYVSCFQGAIVEYAATNGLELAVDWLVLMVRSEVES